MKTSGNREKLFEGQRIISNGSCVETVWNFKPSRNRSKRIYKKLIKRFGVQSTDKPVAFMLAGVIYAHPSIYNQIKDQIK